MSGELSPHGAKELFAALPPIFKLLIVFAIINVLLIAGIASTQLVVFRNTAIVKSIHVGVYWDANCSIPVQGIDWGVIEPGENKTIMVYVRNEGNWAFSLSIWAANWSSPEAEQYMNFTSDYQGQPVAVNEVIPVALILSVAPEIQNIKSFSFDVVIVISG